MGLKMTILAAILASAFTSSNAQLRVVSTENRFPNALAGQSGMQDYCSQFTFVLAKDCDRLVFNFMNTTMQPGGTQDNSNALNINSFTIHDNVSKSVNVTFPTSGTSTLAMAAGDYDQNSNVVTAASMGLSVFSAGVKYYGKVFIDVPATGNNVPLMDRNGFSTAGMAYTWWDRTTTTVSNKTGVGAPTFSGGTTQTKGTGFCPFVLGFVADGSDSTSWALIGDSIMVGTGDNSRTDAQAGGGAWQRACMDGARLIASMNLARVNATTIAYNGVNAVKVRAYLKYGVNFALETDTNDLTATGTGITLANLQANNTQLVTKARAAGAVKVLRIGLFPRADSSSDGFTTVANQVINAQWQSGVPAQALAWYPTQVPAVYDAFVAMNSVRDATVTYAWTVVGGANVQSDGTHPLPIGHIKAASDLQAAIYAMT